MLKYICNYFDNATKGHTVGEVGIERVNILFSRYISNEAVRVKFSQDFGIGSGNPHI